MKTALLRKQSGSSLVVVISVLATLMVIVAVAAEYTGTVNRHVQRSNTEQNATAVADSCIDILFSHWRQICSTPGSVTVAQTSDSFATIPLPTYAQLNLPNVTRFAKRDTTSNWFNPASDDYDATYTISNYKVVAVNAQWRNLGASNVAPEPILGQINDVINSGDPDLPKTPLVYNYVASVDVTLPALGPTGKVVARVRRVFQKQQISPWNFAIFYVDPLEIHPGPPFTVTGWVHTNSDLYTGHNTLTFADKVTYASDWFKNFMTPAANPRSWVDSLGITRYAVPAPGDTTHPETPTSPLWPGNPPTAGVQPLPPARDQAMQPFGLDATSIFSTADTNPNNDSYHELIEQATAGYPDPLTGQRYYDQAGIKILIDASNTVTVKRYDGTTVTGSSSGGDDKKLYNAVIGALTTNQSIWNARENGMVRLATLDIGALKAQVDVGNIKNSGGITRWNNIIYITDTSATINNPSPPATPPPSPVRRGIRLKNGEVLPTNGLSVATANPIYIQGDYNTGTGTVPSNAITGNDPTTPQSSGYTRQPSSVVADAVTILSNNWDDANADVVNEPLANRIATNTTVNTAVIAGIVPTNVSGGGNYSGGAENFPRFLEAWDNIRFTYYGSMIELYQSRQGTAPWSYATIYGAPIRQWYFDTNFRTTPPPGSIMLYSYIKGKWSVF